MGSSTNLFVTSLIFLAMIGVVLASMNNETSPESYYLASHTPITGNVTAASGEAQLQHCWDLYGVDGSEGINGTKLYQCRVAVSANTGVAIGAEAIDLVQWIAGAFNILFYPIRLTTDAMAYTVAHPEYAALLVPVFSFAVFFIGYKLLLVARGTSD